MTVTRQGRGKEGDDNSPCRSTPNHERHADFKAGHRFVFDDALALDDQSKHMIESTLDMLPHRIETFSTSAADCECLVAEKLTTAEGRVFVFIREATGTEIEALYRAEDSDDQLEENEGDWEGEDSIDPLNSIASEGSDHPERVSRLDVRNALKYLISIEPDPARFASAVEYDRYMQRFKPQMERARTTLRSFAEQMQPAELVTMQAAYYAFLEDPRLAVNDVAISVISAALNHTWHGVGPWQR